MKSWICITKEKPDHAFCKFANISRKVNLVRQLTSFRHEGKHTDANSLCMRVIVIGYC